MSFFENFIKSLVLSTYFEVKYCVINITWAELIKIKTVSANFKNTRPLLSINK